MGADDVAARRRQLHAVDRRRRQRLRGNARQSWNGLLLSAQRRSELGATHRLVATAAESASAQSSAFSAAAASSAAFSATESASAQSAASAPSASAQSAASEPPAAFATSAKPPAAESAAQSTAS